MSVRCTPFCSPCDKGYKHHELLVALLNTRDDCAGLSDDADHEVLQHAIKKYKNKGWDINTEIQEENEEFRFPLLHWACVLGKIRTVRWLLDNGFCSTVRTKDTQETCIHRALMTLPEISSTKSGRLSMSRFETILPYFRDCLSMGDHRQNTPLHVAAQFLVQNRCYTLYENLFLTMLAGIKKMPFAKQEACLNAQNSSGDTVLNLLASGCKSLAVIEKVVDAGADSMIVNKLSIGPLDNAERHGFVHIANFLKSSLLRGCGILQSDTEYRTRLLNEDARKRRSERRSTYYSTMASLNMFCRADANDSEKSSELQQLSSPSKGSEKSSKSNEFEGIENIDLETEDEDTSSQSSQMSSSILRNINNTEHTPTSKHPAVLEKSRAPLEQSTPPLEQAASPLERSRAPLRKSSVPLQQSTALPLKHDDYDDSEMCTCFEDENDNAVIIVNDKNEQDKKDSDVNLFNTMKEAGVLENLNDVIAKTMEGHLERIKTLEDSMNELNAKQEERNTEEKRIKRELSRKKREVEKLNSELYNVRRQSMSTSKKRKVMEEETRDLRKKLVCCETLLETVPKDSCK